MDYPLGFSNKTQGKTHINPNIQDPVIIYMHRVLKRTTLSIAISILSVL
jgi:hypothetical protein